MMSFRIKFESEVKAMVIAGEGSLNNVTLNIPNVNFTMFVH